MKNIITFLTVAFLSTQAFGRADGLAAKFSGGETGQSPTPEETLQGIYQPWTGVLASLRQNLDPRRDYVVWIQVPAQHPLDLRSSEYFRRWINATPITEVTISHNMVAWRCHNSKGQVVEAATGMTGGNVSQDTQMFLDGYGLSVFFSVFTDGHLNPVSEVDSYITTNLQKRGAVFGGFEVSPTDCDNMMKFVQDFVHAPNKPYTRFGLLPNPEKMEGGGCVTFASALMNKAGIMQPILPNFYRNIRARRDLMGGNIDRKPAQAEAPETPWLNGVKNVVSPFRLVNTRWERSDIPSVGLKLMDPEKMLYTLKQFGQAYLQQFSGKERVREADALENSPLKQRYVLSIDTISRPGQMDVYPVDDSFDPEMAGIGHQSRNWFLSKLQQGYRIRRGQAAGMPVLLMERN